MTDFGRETSCTDSLRAGKYVSGTRLVAEAIYRRLITPRGTLRGGEREADYGLDLTGEIGTSTLHIKALAARVKNEVTKDERIMTADVTVFATQSGPATALKVQVNATTAAGPFELVLLATDVSVQILGIN